MFLKKTREDFIKEASLRHCGKYDYSLVEYKGTHAPVKIVCPLHGDFEKSPANHLRGQGCQVCAGKGRSNTASFIRDAQEIHGEKYDYSIVEYKGLHIPVKIVCPIHGVFEQTPARHLLQRNGCRACGMILTQTTKAAKNAESFVSKAQDVHGKVYDYKHVEYAGRYSYVKIVCPEHGPFNQQVRVHLKGHGCPFCAGHDQKQSYINSVFDENILVAIKIGISKKWRRRMVGQNRLNLFRSENLGVWEYKTVKACKDAERECKKTLRTGVLSIREMKDGWSETVSVLDLEKVIAIYEKHGGVRIK